MWNTYTHLLLLLFFVWAIYWKKQEKKSGSYMSWLTFNQTVKIPVFFFFTELPEGYNSVDGTAKGSRMTNEFNRYLYYTTVGATGPEGADCNHPRRPPPSQKRNPRALIPLDTAVWGALFARAAFLAFLVSSRLAKFRLCLCTSLENYNTVLKCI